MLTNEQASSWSKQWSQFNRMEEKKCSWTNKLLAEKTKNSIQHNGKNWMLKFLAERKQWFQFNRMQEKNLKGDQASSWKKRSELNSAEWKKGNAHRRTNF